MNGRAKGLIDDIHEGRRWKPIFPLLKRVRESAPGPAQLAAIRAVVEFFLHTSTGTDPRQMPGFRAFNLFVDLAQSDPRVGQIADWIMGVDEIA